MGTSKQDRYNSLADTRVRYLYHSEVFNVYSISGFLNNVSTQHPVSQDFSVSVHSYGMIMISSLKQYQEFFEGLCADISPFLYLDKLKEELPQYASFYAELKAKQARNNYFFPAHNERKLVIAVPEECISLLQVSTAADYSKGVISAYIRSSDLVLFPWDLLFILSIPEAFYGKKKPEELAFLITFSNLHRGNRAPGEEAVRTRFTPKKFVEEVSKYLQTTLKSC